MHQSSDTRVRVGLSRKNPRAWLLWGLTAVLLAPATGLRAQNAGPVEPDPLGPPTERGIRLTPTMVRSITGGFTRGVLVRRYELDETKAKEVTELVTRRVMAAAHANGEQAQALVEMFLAEVAEDDARGREGGHSGGDTLMTPEFCQKLARHVLPLTPALRDLVRDVGQDIRPMLPLKQQLKLGADLTLAGGTLTAFEQNMQRWAEGRAVPGEDPFARENDTRIRDASGASKALQQARKSADNELNKEASIKSLWEKYLEQTKTFYTLDPGQCATADSVFREFMGRLQTLLADARWSKDMYRTRLWLSLSNAVGLSWQNPLRMMLDRKYQDMMDPINELGNEFRIRLDQIPTTAQRAAAEARVTEALAAHGYELTAEAK